MSIINTIFLIKTKKSIFQDKDVYTKISGQVESFLYSQGFSKVTLQPEFPSSSAEDIEEVEGCNLKCKHDECAEITCCNEESGGIFYLSERPSVTERTRLSVTERPEERESPSD